MGMAKEQSEAAGRAYLPAGEAREARSTYLFSIVENLWENKNKMLNSTTFYGQNSGKTGLKPMLISHRNLDLNL
jgi:hypothetical protein